MHSKIETCMHRAGPAPLRPHLRAVCRANCCPNSSPRLSQERGATFVVLIVVEFGAPARHCKSSPRSLRLTHSIMMTSSWWYRHDDIIMTIPSWRYHHDDIIITITARWYRRGDIIMTKSSRWYHQDDIAMMISTHIHIVQYSKYNWYIYIYIYST